VANKIGGIDSSPVRTSGDRPVERADLRARTEPGIASSPVDSSVTLTDAARRLAALERVIAGVPDVDLARVEELRSAIESGRYTVDADRIASRLLDLERELSAVGRPSR
jgi:negative regulator of flagellin synthesis FlgM